jgi:hypothetical protein
MTTRQPLNGLSFRASAIKSKSGMAAVLWHACRGERINFMIEDGRFDYVEWAAVAVLVMSFVTLMIILTGAIGSITG